MKSLAWKERLEEVYLRFLARPPTAAELKLLGHGGKSGIGIREVAWMLLNSREFLYRI